MIDVPSSECHVMNFFEHTSVGVQRDVKYVTVLGSCWFAIYSGQQTCFLVAFNFSHCSVFKTFVMHVITACCERHWMCMRVCVCACVHVRVCALKVIKCHSMPDCTCTSVSLITTATVSKNVIELR